MLPRGILYEGKTERRDLVPHNLSRVCFSYILVRRLIGSPACAAKRWAISSAPCPLASVAFRVRCKIDFKTARACGRGGKSECIGVHGGRAR
jgi:hypothetical protein